MDPQFGAALRRQRELRGISLAALSKAVSYSKGHLGNVERGVRSATMELARSCDSFLGAEGTLVALRARERPPTLEPMAVATELASRLVAVAEDVQLALAALAELSKSIPSGSARADGPG